MTTFKQELGKIITEAVYISGNTANPDRLPNHENIKSTTQAIIELVDREIRKTNISQIENWRDWISTNKELDWLTDEMNEAIEALKDETLTDENGIYLDMKLGLDK